MLLSQLTLLAAAVLSLGEVDFLHPAFHDEKTIFPVGYRAVRVTASQASDMDVVPHLCEILAAEDGSGPVFRYVCPHPALKSSSPP